MKVTFSLITLLFISLSFAQKDQEKQDKLIGFWLLQDHYCEIFKKSMYKGDKLVVKFEVYKKGKSKRLKYFEYKKEEELYESKGKLIVLNKNIIALNYKNLKESDPSKIKVSKGFKIKKLNDKQLTLEVIRVNEVRGEANGCIRYFKKATELEVKEYFAN